MTIARSLTLTLSLIVLIDAPPLAAAQFDIDRQAASIAQQLQQLTHLIGRYTRLVEQYATLDCASQGMRDGAQVTPVGSVDRSLRLAQYGWRLSTILSGLARGPGRHYPTPA